MTDTKTFRKSSLIAALALAATSLVPAGAAVTDDNAYVLLRANSQSSTMSGSMDDVRVANALRSGRESLLYVRRGGARYVIRDAATLAKAQLLFAPQEELGERQSALGARQSELGKRQAVLGAEQARLGRQQSDAKPSRAAELGRQQVELGRRQDALGRQQNALGAQQQALGHEQDRLAHQADAALAVLIDDALRRGIATRVR